MKAGKPRLRADLSECAYTLGAETLRFLVTVSNGEERDVFVTAELRQIQFDASAGLLTCWFSDRGRDASTPGPACHGSTVPQVRPVRGGGKVTLNAELPRRMTRLVPHPDASFHFETLELATVRRAIAHVAVSETPFYFNPNRGGTALAQLIGWGEDLSAEALRTGSEPSAAS